MAGTRGFRQQALTPDGTPAGVLVLCDASVSPPTPFVRWETIDASGAPAGFDTDLTGGLIPTVDSANIVDCGTVVSTTPVCYDDGRKRRGWQHLVFTGGVLAGTLYTDTAGVLLPSPTLVACGRKCRGCIAVGSD